MPSDQPQLSLFDNPPTDADVEPPPRPPLTPGNVKVPLMIGEDRKAVDQLTSIIDNIWDLTVDLDLFKRVLRIWWAVLRRFEGGEDPYLEAIAPWQDKPEVLQLVSQGFGLLTKHYFIDGYISDVLAAVYEHFGHEYIPRKKKDNAYFHTPVAVARLNAQTIVDGFGEDEEHRLQEGPPITVQDPACGTGMLLLAFREAVAERYGRDALRNVRCYAQDIDECCVLATRIQLRMSNGPWMTSFHIAFMGEVAQTIAAQGAA